MGERQKFSTWLASQGAEVLAPTNPYEFARFVAHGATWVIYERASGTITAKGFAREALTAFRKGAHLSMGIAKRQRGNISRRKAALAERDGLDCFFCGLPLGEDITIEHLVAVAKGGPDHMDNLALAHKRCNREAGNLPLVEKIKMHCSARARRAAA